MDTETFIEKAKAVHGDKYDYSKTEYKKSKEKIIIICPEHGEFLQKPNDHLSGYGCSKCAGNTKKTTEQFIEEAKSIHGNKFDYSKVDYKNASTRVCIICPEHGEFWQTPPKHLNSKHGCPECAPNRRLTFEKALEKSKAIHGDKYDYSNVEYKNMDTKVQIKCNSCSNIFWQTFHAHIGKKQGCPYCAGVARLTTEQFIEKAKAIHGNKYDYSKVNYVNYETLVEIICPRHGVFYQTPDKHLTGHGCVYCRNSIGETKIRKFLETNHINFESEKRFPTCKDKSQLPFDFHIPQLNLLIEYQGMQHYVWPNPLHRTVEDFLDSCRRDDIKRQWCSENNIVELEIPYNRIESINKILTEKLIKH